MNILIKLTCLVGLVIAPILAETDHSTTAAIAAYDDQKEMSVQITSDGATDELEATITTSKMVNGERVSTTTSLKGTEEDIQAAISQMKEEMEIDINIATPLTPTPPPAKK